MSEAERVLLAPHLGGRPLSVRVDARGLVKIDGDMWIVVRSADHLARILGGRVVGRGTVLARLQAAGYWPTAWALRQYLAGGT